MVYFDDETNRLVLVRGEGGSFIVDISGYDMQPTDQLILNVRELPRESSPLLLQSINVGNTIRIDCDASKDIPAGLYSAQIFLVREDVHCPMELWPTMSGTPREDGNLKNFVVYPRV